MYIRRFIEPRVLEALQSVPVIIVEGARAVGKTSMMRELYAAGKIKAIHSLTDKNLCEIIADNPLAWLKQQEMPFCIDEAQQLPELPLAIKALLDEREDKANIILTGSASIGQTSLGGTDPLAGRSIRLTLEPLTEAEIFSQTSSETWSAIDYLFDEKPVSASSKNPNKPLSDWNEIQTKGGLPHYRVPENSFSSSLLERRIKEDISSILTRDVLPNERFDKKRALDVLNYLYRNPSGEVNLSQIAKSLHIDNRTVDSYINKIEERFLAFELPNFHLPIKKSRRTGAKIYPLDIALASNTLKYEDTSQTNQHISGGLFEAHIVQQISAHAGWSSMHVRLSHWQQKSKSRNGEVDLVLQDSSGRLVCIEVKTSSAIKAEHLKGLKAFREAYKDNFHRGFVISNIPSPIAIEENIWAIPVTAIYDKSLWTTSSKDSYESKNKAQESSLSRKDDTLLLEDAQIFMSYTHKDQNMAVGGNLRQFAEDIVEALEGLYGRNIKLFTDVNDGQWGEDLWGRLHQELASSTFLLPFITPNYLASEACQNEFMNFSDAATRVGSEQLILPLIWIDPKRHWETGGTIIERLKKTRFLDATVARRASRDSAEYQNKVEEIAERLDQVITAVESAEVVRTDFSEINTQEENLGFLEYLDQAENLMPQMQQDLLEFLNNFGELSVSFQSESLKLQSSSYSSSAQAKNMVLMLAQKLSPLNEKLQDSSQKAAQSWEQMLSKLNIALSLYSEVSGNTTEADSLIRNLEYLRDQVAAINTAELEGIAHQMPKLSSHFAPISRALLSAVSTMRTIESSITNLLESIEAGRKQ